MRWPPRGHRVARVDREIEEHLLDLAAVRPNARERRLGLDGELDVLADDAPQHRTDAAHDLTQVEHRRLQHLLAAEREQLVGEIRRAIRRLDHLAKILRLGAVLVGAHQRELRVARR